MIDNEKFAVWRRGQEAKRKARLAQRKAKRQISSESDPLVKEEIKTHDIKKTITLDDLTNPSQK